MQPTKEVSVSPTSNTDTVSLCFTAKTFSLFLYLRKRLQSTEKAEMLTVTLLLIRGEMLLSTIYLSISTLRYLILQHRISFLLHNIYLTVLVTLD